MTTIQHEFREAVGSSFISELVGIIGPAYPAAQAACVGLDEHVKANVSGNHRWGAIETELYSLGAAHGMEVEWKPNAANSSHHVELRVGRFVITVSKTEGPGQLPVDADFRRTLIEATQPRLFEDRLIPSDGYIYALVVHGPVEDKGEVGFIQALFPDRDGSVCDRLDLLEIARAETKADVQPEVIADGAAPVLRPRRPAAGGETAQSTPRTRS